MEKEPTKPCFKCNRTLALSEFYKHSKMPDGTVNKCKDCNKRDVQENYRKNKSHYVEYERKRFQTPERKAQMAEYQRKRRQTNPEKYKARIAVGNAIRDGKLTKQPCEKCGVMKVQAHHDDYFKPLDVRWLCFKHHREHHGQEVYRT